MKKQVIMLASLLAASHGVAFANNTEHAAVQFSSVEAQQLFEQDTQPMQVAALSSSEMKQTEGAWGIWGATIGGIGGAAGYFLENRISGSSWSWTSFGFATAGGVRAGALAGPVGVVWGFNAAISGGTTLGIAQRYGW
jgi:hypothetical protein